MAEVLVDRALALHAARKYDRAIADYNEAIRLRPNWSLAHEDRGITWAAKGDYDSAIADFNEAIRLDPGLARSYYNRGETWRSKGEYDKAIADYYQAMRRDPEYPSSYSGLAWVHSTCPDAQFRDGTIAVEYAKKLCGMTGWNHSNWLNTLAAAYAEAGDFCKAIEWQEKAIELAPEDRKTELRPRLELYKSGKAMPANKSATLANNLRCRTTFNTVFPTSWRVQGLPASWRSLRHSLNGPPRLGFGTASSLALWPAEPSSALGVCMSWLKAPSAAGHGDQRVTWKSQRM